jgi:hypothetical protein
MSMTVSGSTSLHSKPREVSRRSFLGTTTLTGAAAFASSMKVLDALQTPSLAAELKRQQKSVILLWLAGGASQLETWDPKPGRLTGGPFRAISTDIAGIQISELLPKMAQRMRTTAILRSLNTRNGDHGGGTVLMETGRAKEAAVDYPDLGAIIAHELGRADSQVPDYVSLYSETEGRHKGGPGFLGARYAPMFLSDSMIPPNIRRLETIAETDHQDRAAFQKLLARRFQVKHPNAAVSSHGMAYERVRGLMSSESLFDVSREPQSARDFYGPTQFQEQCLIARRLVEAGVPFVKVARAWWDSHGQNFETHRELCADLDQGMSALLDDLAQRGMLENTLVLTFGEFGRTPHINASLGRDHFANAWSASLSGCGIKGGSVYGKTDADGQTVVEGEAKAGDLFATIFAALGIDPAKEYHFGARPVPIVDFGCKPIQELLA